jgi:hypothetical protein
VSGSAWVLVGVVGVGMFVLGFLVGVLCESAARVRMARKEASRRFTDDDARLLLAVATIIDDRPNELWAAKPEYRETAGEWLRDIAGRISGRK